MRFYPTAAAAQKQRLPGLPPLPPRRRAGLRRLERARDVVGRAMRMIGDGIVDREGVPGLAGRLGYSTRQVQRQLTGELGAGPVALARAQRAHTARVLLQTTGLPVTEIAFASGFASVRQFNDTIRQIDARTPSLLRAESGTGSAGPSGADPALAAGIPLRLAYRGTYAAGEVFDLLAGEAVPRVEEMLGEPGARTYRRTLRLPYGTGIAAVGEAPHSGWLEARIQAPTCATSPPPSSGCAGSSTWTPTRTRRRAARRRPGAGAAGRARPRAAARRARRTPDEFALRGAGGPGGRGRLVEAVREGPGPAVRRADPRLPRAGRPRRGRGPGAAGLAAALADGIVRLGPGADRDEAERALRALPGVGARTAALIRMRALGDPDVAPEGEGFPSGTESDAWRPWRSYAVRHLWTA